MRTHFAFVSSLGVIVLAASAVAQRGSVTVTTTESPVSVVMAGRSHVICSVQQGSKQYTVDVSTPAMPQVVANYDPPYGDQFADAVHTDAFGGRLVTGHRGGGLNLIDASNPAALAVLHSQAQPPKYLHEGLRIWSSATDTYLAYSEHNVSNSGGGLILYQFITGGTQLTPTGTGYLQQGFDGNACEISADGSTVWQLGWSNNSVLNGHLAVYDTNGWMGDPSLVTTVPVPYTVSNYSRDLVRCPASPNLLAALGWDGLRAVDVVTPRNPRVNTIIGASSEIYIDGVVFVPASSIALAWGLVRVSGNDFDFLVFLDASAPGFAVPITALAMPVRIHDIKVARNGRVFLLGRDRSTGDVVLQVY